MTAVVLRERLTELVGAVAVVDRVVEAVLDLARGVDAGDREGAGVLLEVAGVVGRCEQARYGQLIQLLGQVDRVGAHRAGLIPWMTSHLDVSDGKARGIAEAANRIGALPELAGPLSSGQVGADTVRALTRTAKAVEGTGRDQVAALTETLELAEHDGVGAATRQVRVLEHTIDPAGSEELLAKQRARSFARVVKLENGMCRFDILLDPIRATTLLCAIDVQTADCIRQRQYDGTDPLPADVRSTDQLNAQAVARLAEVFLDASPEQRRAKFAAPVLYSAPLDEGDGLAESVYGVLVPRSAITPSTDPKAHLLHIDRDGQPALLDGKEIDADPHRRLASPAQRIALAFRDRHCTYPGCRRPPTWSLHAHHTTPYREGGATVLRGMSLLCSEHHGLVHHPAP